MTNYHPIFPLELVVYPRERVNLHIFEPRYIHMIQQSVSTSKPFVMGVMLKNELQEIGCLVKIHEVKRTYEDGKMDITIEGINPVKILEFIKSTETSLPHNAIIYHLENELETSSRIVVEKVYQLMLTLHQELNLLKKFDVKMEDLLSYDFAHHIGFSFEEEYRLLGFTQENQRLELMRLHLENLIAVVKNLESLKNRVRMNGEFRNLKGFDFD